MKIFIVRTPFFIATLFFSCGQKTNPGQQVKIDQSVNSVLSHTISGTWNGLCSDGKKIIMTTANVVVFYDGSKWILN